MRRSAACSTTRSPPASPHPRSPGRRYAGFSGNVVRTSWTTGPQPRSSRRNGRPAGDPDGHGSSSRPSRTCSPRAEAGRVGWHAACTAGWAVACGSCGRGSLVESAPNRADSAGPALERVRRERVGVDAQLSPPVQLVGERVDLRTERIDEFALRRVGPILDLLAPNRAGFGELLADQPAPLLQLLDGGAHLLLGPGP